MQIILRTAAILLAATAFARPAAAYYFGSSDLVVSIYGNGDGSGPYTDNEASPIVLQEITRTGTVVSTTVLPQSTTSANGVTNYAISGEYGSSSEGTLQRSVNGQYLTIAGYGVSATAYNNTAGSNSGIGAGTTAAGFGGATKTCITSGSSAATCYPLAQTSSTAGTPSSSGVGNATVVPRVVALVGTDGSVDTSTALTGVFNENNPRSVATVDGSSFYLSGQGKTSNQNDTTQGVFYATKGATTATTIDNSFDTRTVSLQNGQLTVSSDTTEGSGVHENISTYGTAGNPPTSSATATILGNTTKLKSVYQAPAAAALNSLDTNLLNTAAYKAKGLYLSPENYFYANSTTLYIADSGNPKGDNNGSGKSTQGLSDGGLQKWSYNSTTGNWTLEYTLSAGLLNFVADTTTCGSNQVNCGTTGLIGLAGDVVGDNVFLFATNSTLGDLDQTYLYSITDSLSATALPTSESFSVLETAAPGTLIRGVALAPVPEPASAALLLGALVPLVLRRRKATVQKG
jgi:hypothetical protein